MTSFRRTGEWLPLLLLQNLSSSLNMTSTVRIRETFNATLEITMPPETVGRCLVDFRSPNMSSVSSELFTISKVTASHGRRWRGLEFCLFLVFMKIVIIKSGRNLGLLSNEVYNLTDVSSRNNSQKDTGRINPHCLRQHRWDPLS